MLRVAFAYFQAVVVAAVVLTVGGLLADGFRLYVYWPASFPEWREKDLVVIGAPAFATVLLGAVYKAIDG